MRILPFVVIACSLTLALTTASSALTIQSGVYPMQWRTESKSAGREDIPQYHFLKISSRIARDVKGIVSAKALRANGDGAMLILDESKGTGKGYDVLYVMRGAKYGSKVDLKNAVKVPLQQFSGTLAPPGGKSFTVPVTVGNTERQALVDVRIPLISDKSGGKKPAFIQYQLRGGLRGVIATNIGNLEAEPVDGNGNGAYNNLWTKTTTGDTLRLFLRRGPRSAEERLTDVMPTNLALRSVNLFADHLYEIKVSPSGGSVDIRPYSGPTGTVKIEATDGFGKPARVAYVFFDNGRETLYFGPETDQFLSPDKRIFTDRSSIVLPAGDYDMFEIAVVTPDPADPTKVFGPSISNDLPINVVKDQTTTVKIGGPIKMRIMHLSGVIQTKSGGAIDIPVRISVGHDPVEDFYGNRQVELRILDAKGKCIWREQVGFDSDGICGTSMRIPMEWKPGIYKITSTLDAKPYHDFVKAAITLKITK